MLQLRHFPLLYHRLSQPLPLALPKLFSQLISKPEAITAVVSPRWMPVETAEKSVLQVSPLALQVNIVCRRLLTTATLNHSPILSAQTKNMAKKSFAAVVFKNLMLVAIVERIAHPAVNVARTNPAFPFNAISVTVLRSKTRIPGHVASVEQFKPPTLSTLRKPRRKSALTF